jgi:hypothetical protein
MSTRLPDREPVAHDAADGLLDKLLADADEDLRAALGDVIDLDAGLTAIVGSHGFERTIVGPDVVGDSGLIPPRRRPRWLFPRLVRAFVGFTALWVKLLPLKRSDMTMIPIATGRSPRRQSLARVFDQVNSVVNILTKLNRSAIGSKQRRSIRECVVLLVYLCEKLKDGNVTRDEVKEIIAKIQRTLKAALAQRSLHAEVAYYSLLIMTVAAAGFASATHSWTTWAALALTILQFVIIVRIESRMKLESKKGGKFSKIYSKLASLERTVDRLFDDTDDRDRNWSNLPC